MNFLNPIALATGLLGGLIVLMYLLKLRRQPRDVSSTMLWMKSIEDLTANAPFQRLRQNILMYLQILFLLMLAVALARPMLWMNRREGVSRIIMIDNSASMNATDAGPEGNLTRLDQARDIAHTLVGNMSGGDRAMIVTLGGEAHVLAPFSGERATLNRAIDAAQATDARASIREALLLAQGVRKVDLDAVITIISDGGLGYLGNLITEDDPIEFICTGSSDDNRGIVSFDLRESFEEAGRLQAFAEVENFSSEPATTLVRCLIDGEVFQVREETIAPKSRQGFAFQGLEAGSAHTLRIELSGNDALASDDTAHALLDFDLTTHILLVTGGNYFLERFLVSQPSLAVEKIEPAHFDPTVQYDLVIFDQFSPGQLGPGHYLFINTPPPWPGFESAGDPLKNQMILDWNQLHPVTRYANFGALVTGEALNLTQPEWMTPLAESAETTLISAGSNRGLRLVTIGFDIYSTDWPLQVSFPIFLTNAIDWLAAGGEGPGGLNLHKTGDTLTLIAAGPMQITGPDGQAWQIQPDEHGVAYFNQTKKAGLYQTRIPGVEGGEDTLSAFAVNLLAPAESDIAPRRELLSGEKKISASQAGRENRQIWPWFVLAGVLLLGTEWHIYCRKSWL